MVVTSPGRCERKKRPSTSVRPGSAQAGSLRSTSPEGLLQLARKRWSSEGWHWMRDTQLHEDAHRYRGNSAGVMGRLRTAAAM